MNDELLRAIYRKLDSIADILLLILFIVITIATCNHR